MPVAVVLEFEGGTLEQYDRIRELMGLDAGGDTPPGALFHWVTATDDGIRVTDVWESRETFEAFAQSHIAPLAEQAGVPNPPQIQYHEVHNHLAAS